MNALDNSSILITGGTGSFGRALTSHLLEQTNVSRVVIFSRDELKQYEMKLTFGDDRRIRWFLGDIRDRDRLQRAVRGVQYVIHAAALKQVDTAEYNPFEFVKTNVIGSQNIIDACINEKVQKVIALSTDKASSPINLYGATKLTADKLFVAANNYTDGGKTALSVVRYGNVVGSRGSVIPHFMAAIEEGRSLPITDPRMTRFWISIDDAVRFVLSSLDQMSGGELYVPRIPSMKITDLVEALSPGYSTHIIGIRPGEKLHEEMISAEDSTRTVQQDDRFVVVPTIAHWGFVPPVGEAVEKGFSYRSDSNDQWLTAVDLRKLLGLG